MLKKERNTVYIFAFIPLICVVIIFGFQIHRYILIKEREEFGIYGRRKSRDRNARLSRDLDNLALSHSDEEGYFVIHVSSFKKISSCDYGSDESIKIGVVVNRSLERDGGIGIDFSKL